MSEDHVRSTYEIKKSLLKKAIKEGRGPEMIMMIQWRLSYIKHISEDDKEAVRESALLNDDQPRAIRMLNTIAKHKGEEARFSQTTDSTSIH